MEMKTTLGLYKLNESMKDLLLEQGFDIPKEIRIYINQLGLRIEKEIGGK